jgi:preprotein translocase subunit SecG
MQNVLLIVHLILALCLIGVVLLQRSEGGGLGIGGGGGSMTGRSPTTALGKMTWIFAIAFICTSIALTIFAAKNSADSSVLDRLGIDAPAPVAPELPGLPSGGSLLPPTTGDAPAQPPRAE